MTRAFIIGSARRMATVITTTEAMATSSAKLRNHHPNDFLVVIRRCILAGSAMPGLIRCRTDRNQQLRVPEKNWTRRWQNCPRATEEQSNTPLSEALKLTAAVCWPNLLPAA